MIKAVLMLVLVLLLPANLTAQLPQYVLESDCWSNSHFLPSVLELTKSQSEYQTKLIEGSGEEIRQLTEELGFSEKAALRQHNRKCNLLFLDNLNKSQGALFVRFLNYRAAGAGLHPKSLSGKFAREELSLTDIQIEKLEKIAGERLASRRKFIATTREKFDESLKKASEKIHLLLTPDQRKRKLALIGESFEFDESFGQTFQNACDNCTSARNSIARAGLGSSRTTSSSDGFEISFLEFCVSPIKLDIAPFYATMVELANNDKVAEELSLNSDQREMIKLRYTDLQHQMKGIIEIRQEFKSKPTLDDIFEFKVKYKSSSPDGAEPEFKNLSLKDHHKNELRGLLDELTPSQQKRLLQLFYRWIAETGTEYKRVHNLEFHPGWTSYLELDEEQISEINELRHQLIIENKRLDKESIYSHSVSPVRDYIRALEVLTKRQRELWDHKTGPFSRVSDEMREKIQGDGA